MNAGIEMLIERLKTHPEDFHFSINSDAYSTPWGDILKEALNCGYITEEEQEAVRDARVESQREYFTHKVLKTLTMTNNPKTESFIFKSTPHEAGLTWSSITPSITPSNTITTSGLTLEEMQQFKAIAKEWVQNK